MAFDAFLSYSYEADGNLATSMQRGLARLARPWNKTRALHVFRDQTGLSANPALWNSITTALDDSEWLILLSSPSATSSKWVSREVEHWCTNRPTDRILLVLTEGTLTWDPRYGDFDPDQTTALPAALYGRYQAEPRYLDLRWAHNRTDLDLHNPQFRSATAELAAPIRGVRKDELESEDLRLTKGTAARSGDI